MTEEIIAVCLILIAVAIVLSIGLSGWALHSSIQTEKRLGHIEYKLMSPTVVTPQRVTPIARPNGSDTTKP